MVNTTVGIYQTKAGAENVVSGLRAAGFRDEEIGLTARDWDGWYQVTVEADGTRVVVARNGGSDRVRHPSRSSAGD